VGNLHVDVPFGFDRENRGIVRDGRKVYDTVSRTPVGKRAGPRDIGA
jgi:hypothetical protein